MSLQPYLFSSSFIDTEGCLAEIELIDKYSIPISSVKDPQWKTDSDE